MGRPRIHDEEKKKVPVRLSIRKDVIDEAKKQYPNKVSQMVEDYLKKILNMD